ncbi:MAG: Ppx/GppA phosphatase family protein [Candidatus Xenobia bacterium]
MGEKDVNVSVRELVQAVAAIDVGSNAMRMVIANVSRHGDVTPVASLREAVRLGQDVFTDGLISEETTERALEAFGRFRQQVGEHGVRAVRAVATSALREAHNREMFVDRVAQETGIEIQIIGGEEEARLVTLAVDRRLNLRHKMAMLIDIGGGSVEVTLCRDGHIVAADSFNMGTVRLLQRIRESGYQLEQAQQMIREYADVTRVWLDRRLNGRRIDTFVGTGGNVEALLELRRTVMGPREDSIITADELDRLVETLQHTTYEERMERFRLRPDRADVILPAAIVLQTLLRQGAANAVQIPGVGLKDGLIFDLLPDLLENRKDLHRDQVLEAALGLGRKYSFDEAHGLAVQRHANQLFDITRDLHHLGDEHRLLLEVAALLHDVGQYINISGHHKHSWYLLAASPIVGLSDQQRHVVANVARYHRKSSPSLRHEPYKLLSPKDRLGVTKLAALLRLADALDAEHGSKVQKLKAEFKRPRLVLHLEGDGDLLLEKWSLSRKAALFEEVFGIKLLVES